MSSLAPTSQVQKAPSRTQSEQLALHHIAGLSAGASMELAPGQWDLGPAPGSADRLQGGDPSEVDFTLTVDDSFNTWLEPGSNRVRIDDQPVLERTLVGSRTIWAGASRFTVGPMDQFRPLSIPNATRPGALHPWITDAAPEPILGGHGGLGTEELIELRRRLHPGVVDIGRFAWRGGGSLWFRKPEDPLFGFAAVCIADLVVDALLGSAGRHRGMRASVPVSVDLLAQPTVVIGSRRHQLALVAQLLVNCAVTTHPEHLQFGLDSDRPDLSFVRDLPHWAGTNYGGGRSAARKVLVVDRTGQNRPRSRWPRSTDDGSLLVLGRRGDPIPSVANVLTIGANGSIALHVVVPGSDRIRMIAGATPIGISPLMAREIVDRLARHKA